MPSSRYGNPGTVDHPALAWRKENVIAVRLPWPMVNIYTKRPQMAIFFHRLGKDRLIAALTAVMDHACLLAQRDPRWQAERIALKQQYANRTTEFYDSQMHAGTALIAMEIIRKFGGDLFSGSYVHRAMRGGEELSTHAYAISLDINHTQNPMGKPLRTTFPDWYVKCFEGNGFTWGGRWVSRPDPMHMELRD